MDKTRRLILGYQSITRTLRDRYYLYDRFDTARAAGAVNGTLAEPVGGVRSVTDTNGKITISGGLISFATGLAINDKVSWTTITRALGVGVISTIILADATSKPNIGWNGADLFIFNNASNFLYANVNAAAFPVVGAYTATTYQTAIIYRAAGAFWFIKGGAFTNWTMMYNSLLGTANRTPQVLTQIATSIFTVDNMRVSKQTYIPVPLQSDGMSAATTDGLGNPEGNGAVGNAYDGVGTPAVAAGVRGFSALSGGGLGVSVLACSSANVNIEVNVTRTAGSAGIIARRVDANNYIQCLHNGTNVIVSQVVAGVSTTLSTTAVAYSAGATMKFHIEGETYRAFYNNTAAGTGTVPASTNTNHGIITNDLSGSFDNLVIWARSGYEGLNLL